MSDSCLAELQAVLGADGVLTGGDVPEGATHDWLGLPAVAPLALLRPRTTEAVSAALAVCHRHRVAVVPQGGMTGLVGGAHPVPGAVALSTDRMAGVIEVDPDTATATVWAGTPLAAVQAAAEEHGLAFPLDLGARGSCTIGGTLGTNAGGNRVIRYGMARDLVVSLEAVLANGTVVGALGKMLKNNTGYDLRHLLIGSEGTLAIVTRAVLKLQARPLTRQVALCGLADFAAVLALLRRARARLGPALTSFEVMWPSFYDFMADRLPGVRRPLAGRHGMYVLVESCGFDPGRDEERLEQALGEAMEAGILDDAAIARSEREAAELWAPREGVSQYGRLLGSIMAFDVGFAIPDLQPAVDEISALLHRSWPGIVALFYGHIGDGNLHVVAHLPGVAAQPEEEVAKAVYGVVAQLRGTISAEHGIGLAKKPYLAVSRSEAELDVLRRIKRALDPERILNPGKVIDA